MTEAVSKKSKKNSASAEQEQLRTTHPGYKEYSWDSISGQQSTQAESSYARADASAVLGDRRHTFGGIPGAGRRTAGSGISSDRTADRANRREKTGTQVGTASAAKTQVAAKPRVKRKTITYLHTITAEKTAAFPVSAVLTVAAFLIVIMSIVTSFVQINDINKETNKLRNEYSSLLSQENELKLLLETRDDLRVVEEAAKNRLRMVKKDQVDKYYLTVKKEDYIEIIQDEVKEESGIIEWFKGVYDGFSTRIRSLFGI